MIIPIFIPINNNGKLPDSDCGRVFYLTAYLEIFLMILAIIFFIATDIDLLTWLFDLRCETTFIFILDLIIMFLKVFTFPTIFGILTHYFVCKKGVKDEN